MRKKELINDIMEIKHFKYCGINNIDKCEIKKIKETIYKKEDIEINR